MLFLRVNNCHSVLPTVKQVQLVGVYFPLCAEYLTLFFLGGFFALYSPYPFVTYVKKTYQSQVADVLPPKRLWLVANLISEEFLNM